MRNGTDEMPAVRAAMENLVAREMFCWRTTSRSMSPGSKPAGRRGHRYDLTRARVVRGTHTEGGCMCRGDSSARGQASNTGSQAGGAHNTRRLSRAVVKHSGLCERGILPRLLTVPETVSGGRHLLIHTVPAPHMHGRIDTRPRSSLQLGARPRHNAAAAAIPNISGIQLAFPAPCGSSTSSEEPLATMEKPCGAVSVRLRLRLSACTAIGICRHLKTGLQCGDSSPMQRADFSLRL